MTERNINLNILLRKLPYLYFIGIFFLNAISGMQNNITNWFLNLVMCIPFLYQLIFEKRSLNIILGCLFLVWSCWMTLAYLSDSVKITEMNYRSLRFIFTGGAMVIFNFLASISILRKIKAGGSTQTSIA